jgi:hypothetical protein
MASKSYVVTAPTALVYMDGRKAAVTLAKGGTVPADADAEHVKLLLERKLIEEGEAAGGVESDPDADPPFPAPAKQSSKPDGKQ